MDEAACRAALSPEEMMEIIRLQTEIVKLGPDLGAVMDLVAGELQRLTDASGAIVELAEGEDMVYRSASGSAAGQLGLRLSRSSSLSGLCVATGEVLRCDDSETDDRVDREACRRVGLRSMVVCPLICQDAVVGVLKAVSPQPAAFTETQVCALGLVSDLVAASMFYATKYALDDLYFKATHDILTGLANRALFYDRLRQALALAARRSGVVGVLNMDMDGLKGINDGLGHRAGDAAIIEVARRAQAVARDSDTVARLGGDEYGVILAEVADRPGAERTAERIAEALARPFTFEDQPLPLRASIGVALYPEDAREMDDLLEKADRAMYRVKRARKGDAAR